VKLELNLAEELGSSLSDGSAAAEFRMGRIDPNAGICSQIVLAFTGVCSANSSFVNALVSGFMEQHGPKVLDQLLFKDCSPVTRVLVESSITLGLEKHERIA
jgi:hypothetical protein